MKKISLYERNQDKNIHNYIKKQLRREETDKFEGRKYTRSEELQISLAM